MFAKGSKAFLIVAIFSIACFITGCNRPQFSEPLPETVDFNYHIRPILVRNCYLCHGPNPSNRKTDLRLDTFEGATAKLEEGGQAIVPGWPSKSKLIDRITYQDPDLVMPPPESNLKLSDREVALLRKWIDQGAEWKPHWSLIKPDIEINDVETNNIDVLINEQIKKKGLTTAAIADKNTLIRRVSYILTGLPPNPSDINDFVNDDGPEVYERMVDNYLASPAYGERWARHWMDLVRYAETKGHEFDYEITGPWRFRDYLIRAFNEDIPYDQLVREHLAGDLLNTVRRNPEIGINESHIGTAFYILGEGTHSPVDVRQDEADRIDNMIDVTTKTFLGLTVSCARCHDHKFDPITTEDYYALFGVMESSRFSPVSADLTLEEERNAKELQKLKVGIREMIADKWMADEDKLHDQYIAEVLKTEVQTPDYEMIGDFRGSSLDGWKSNGLAFTEKTTLGNPIIDKQRGRLYKLEDGKASSRLLGTGIFGVLRSPNIIIDKDFIGVRAMGKRSTIRIIIDNFQLISFPIYGEMDQKVDTSVWNNYVFDVSLWKGHKAYLEVLPGEFEKHVYNLSEDAFVEVQYAVTYNNDWPKVVEQVMPDSYELKDLVNAWAANDILPDQLEILNLELSKGTLETKFPDVIRELEQSERLTLTMGDTSFYQGIYDGFGINSPVFNRGSYKDLSDQKIPRGFLSAIKVEDSVFQSEGSGRLELANAILSPDNPLTSRVMVNRIWHHLFGRGIVETVDNFGLQGKLPSHPELLDYLAVKFRKEGWSIKNMIRFIVTSETFKRVTNPVEETRRRDPDNIWLASFPIRRLEAESIRDGLLAISGKLDETMFGPPVPIHLTDFMRGPGRPEISGPLDGDGRRSIYQEVRRNFLEPMMLTFDRPIPFNTFGKRNVTNVPTQSLILMNDPFVASQAEVMARALIDQSGRGLEERIRWIYIRALSRDPTLEEIDKARDFINALTQSSDLEGSAKENEIMIWKEYCHSIFNLKEFIYMI